MVALILSCCDAVKEDSSYDSTTSNRASIIDAARTAITEQLVADVAALINLRRRC